jgi:hypothetical protein
VSAGAWLEWLHGWLAAAAVIGEMHVLVQEIPPEAS